MSKSILRREEKNNQLNPFHGLSEIESSFDRLFNEMVNVRRQGPNNIVSFSPTCEVNENKDSYQFKFDLPGVAKEDLRVEVVQDRLIVHAERREEKKTDEQKKYLSEVFYGSYSRTFTLPGPVDEKKVHAKYDKGVLTITVPRVEVGPSKQIQIQ